VGRKRGDKNRVILSYHFLICVKEQEKYAQQAKLAEE
jgi:hypothetical protein